MFAPVRVYSGLAETIRSFGVPVAGVDFGANVLGTIAMRVARLRAAVEGHVSTQGRVVLVAHSMSTLVCARYLLERPHGVLGFVSICGVFGGLRRWTLAGWPIFFVVREMHRGLGPRLPRDLAAFLRSPSVPTTIFQAELDEFVRDQSPFAEVVRFDTSVTHIGPVWDVGAREAIAARVAAYAKLPTTP